MRVAWITDPHLNHADLKAWEHFVASLRQESVDAMLITGDISEGPDVAFQLDRLASAFIGPIYFVLGNHDFYQSSVQAARRMAVDLCRKRANLTYLTDSFSVKMAPQVAIVGEDGWGDATVGDFERSPVVLADFQFIADFQPLMPDERKRKLQRFGQEAADRLQPKLVAAFKQAKVVAVATHVPPFREACWYRGRTTDDLWAPFFVCGQIGKVLEDSAAAFPNHEIVVFCGHTHHRGVARLRDNLTVVTGDAMYGKPQITGLLEMSNSSCRWTWG